MDSYILHFGFTCMCTTNLQEVTRILFEQPNDQVTNQWKENNRIFKRNIDFHHHTQNFPPPLNDSISHHIRLFVTKSKHSSIYLTSPQCNQESWDFQLSWCNWLSFYFSLVKNILYYFLRKMTITTEYWQHHSLVMSVCFSVCMVPIKVDI